MFSYIKFYSGRVLSSNFMRGCVGWNIIPPFSSVYIGKIVLLFI